MTSELIFAHNRELKWLADELRTLDYSVQGPTTLFDIIIEKDHDNKFIYISHFQANYTIFTTLKSKEVRLDDPDCLQNIVNIIEDLRAELP